MPRFKKPAKEDHSNAAGKEGCWEIGGNSEYSVVISDMEKLMVEFSKRRKDQQQVKCHRVQITEGLEIVHVILAALRISEFFWE